MSTDTSIYAWHIEPVALDDGPVFNLVGVSDEARVVFNCVTEDVAIELQSILQGRVEAASAESTV